ncbi:PHP domain-containing protein, partial [Crocinitomicaceae bacterium]|nr:PHP domain-containing protein [Crocinitomicaceae bacterium]
MYLNTHTYYSLRYGVVSPEILLKLAKEKGCSTIAITDINTTSACLECIREASRFGIKPILGVDFRNGVQQQFVLIAKNNQGFKNINYYLTEILHDKLEVPYQAPVLNDVFVIYPFGKKRERTLKTNEYIGVNPEDIPYIRLKNIDTSKAVILQTATFRNKKDFNTHRLLRAIDKNVLLSKLSDTEQGRPEHQMLPIKELHVIYEEFPEVIANTEDVLDRCTIDFDFSQEAEHQNQKTYLKTDEEDIELLERLCQEGLFYRYPNVNQEVYDRIDKEL